MPGLTVAYCRTSTQEQVAGLEQQITDVKAAGAERIFSEHISSVAPKRPELTACLAFLREGDTLLITKPDRLARSVADLLRLVDDLEVRKVRLVILSMGGERLDTSNPTAKLMLTLLAGVAAWEREIMLERQRPGLNGRRPRANTRAARVRWTAARCCI